MVSFHGNDAIHCGIANVTILKSVTIGQGGVIAARAVVTKSCERYSIIGGIPAKPFKMRFAENEIIKHEQIWYENEKKRFFSITESRFIKV